MNVNEQSVVTINNYNELENMLNAEDKASSSLAVTILEQSNYEESKVFILLLLKSCFKNAFGTVKEFKEMSPALSEKVTKELEDNSEPDITKLSFKAIYELAQKKGDNEEIEFILSVLAKELNALLTDFDYEFVNFTEVLIKPLGWEAGIKKELENARMELTR